MERTEEGVFTHIQEVKFEDPSDNIEVIFHNGVPISVISKGDMMKPIAAQRQNLACSTTT